MLSTAVIATLVFAFTAEAASASVCQDVSIPVSLDTVSKDIPLSWTVANITVEGLQSALNLPNIAVTGSYVIAGTFCEPSTEIPSRKNTLQVLLHGAAYTRTYWNSLDLNQTTYSWVDYAASQGYPSLAIDRLCNGRSSHPNGLTCTVMTHAETTHQIVQQARSGSLSLGRSARKFSTIILVGHSVGSEVVSRITQTHPSDPDAVILTGWSNSVTNGIPGITYGNVTPASIAYPDRYANLSSDPTYLTFASKSGQSYLSYYGAFKQSIQDFDYATQGTFTLGEALTQLFGQFESPSYLGSVLLLNGNEDATYCQPDPLSSAARGIGNCTEGNSANSASNYPAARRFSFAITPNTGHDLNLHTTAQQSYQAAFSFLTRSGF